MYHSDVPGYCKNLLENECCSRFQCRVQEARGSFGACPSQATRPCLRRVCKWPDAVGQAMPASSAICPRAQGPGLQAKHVENLSCALRQVCTNVFGERVRRRQDEANDGSAGLGVDRGRRCQRRRRCRRRVRCHGGTPNPGVVHGRVGAIRRRLPDRRRLWWFRERACLRRLGARAKHCRRMSGLAMVQAVLARLSRHCRENLNGAPGAGLFGGRLRAY